MTLAPARYDYATPLGPRGPMTRLRDRGGRIVVLVDWPGSLLSAYRADVLTGVARVEAVALEVVQARAAGQLDTASGATVGGRRCVDPHKEDSRGLVA